MGYKLELGAWSAVFAVPNALVDRYIKEADGDQLKVMLWLLRHNGRPYAAEDLAAALGITPQRVDTALGFWMKSGLICSVDTPLDPALTPNHVESPMPVAPQPKAAPTQLQRPTAPKRMLRPDGLYISERVESSPEIRRLVEEAQNLLGKTLSPALSGRRERLKRRAASSLGMKRAVTACPSASSALISASTARASSPDKSRGNLKSTFDFPELICVEKQRAQPKRRTMTPFSTCSAVCMTGSYALAI